MTFHMTLHNFGLFSGLSAVLVLAPLLSKWFPKTLYGPAIGFAIFFWAFGMAITEEGNPIGVILILLAFVFAFLLWPRHRKAPGDSSGGLIFFD